MKNLIRIIHAPADDEIAVTVLQTLEGAGYRCSITKSWEVAPQRSKDKIQVVVLLLSHALIASAELKQEVERVADIGKCIVAFRLDKSPLSKQLEYYLSTTHWLDASTPPIKEHVAQLPLTVRQLIDLQRPRTAWKGKTATILGIVGALGINIFGFVAIVLAIFEFRSIKAGRAGPSSRKYAWIGLITGLMGSIFWVILMFRWWYWDIYPAPYLLNWLNGVS
jgi:hypothetical protein